MLPEWKQVLEVCNKFVAKEITPHSLEADQGSDREFITNTIQQLSQIGILGILLPEEYGGTDMGPLAASLVLDILSSGCASIATALAYHFASQAALQKGGSLSQRQQWLVPCTQTVSTHTWLATCISPACDPPCPEDHEGLAFDRLEKGLVLDGKSALVVGARLATSFLVFARPRGDLVEGPVTCLIIPSDRKGIKLGDKEIFSGLKALPIQSVIFHEVQVDNDDLIGEVNKADALLVFTHNLLYTFLGAIAMGLARTAYSKTLAYACERYQYGKVIALHQEIQRMLGTMLTLLHAGTALYIQSLSGEPLDGICSKARGDYAKIFCTNAALEITIDAIQIHGGYGYMQDYGVEKLMRDAKLLQLLESQNPVLQIEAARCEVEKAGLTRQPA